MRPHHLITRRGRWWAEVVLAVAFYELYNLVQSKTSGERDDAIRHADQLVRLERHLHIWIEPAFNRFATRNAWFGLADGYYYEIAHVVVTASVLTLVWRRVPSTYLRLRNALLVTSLLALIVFWLWPVAPPRFVSSGFFDTLVRNDLLGARHVHGFVNLYAAMPSLHVAWACWCALAVTLATRSRWRWLAWLYPAMTTTAVLGTANHFVLDVVAGAALALSVTLVALRWPRLRAAASAAGADQQGLRHDTLVS